MSELDEEADDLPSDGPVIKLRFDIDDVLDWLMAGFGAIVSHDLAEPGFTRVILRRDYVKEDTKLASYGTETAEVKIMATPRRWK